MQFWAGADGCAPTPSTTSSGTVRIDVWQGCRGGSAVSLVTITGGGHDIASLTAGGTTPATRIWTFLGTHTAQPASAQGTPKLHARLASARAEGAPEHRRVVVKLALNLPATAMISLLRGSSTVASRLVKMVAGTPQVQLVPPAGAHGRYKLKVMLTAAGNQAVTLKRSLTLP
jgi:hypothetical protein